MTHFLQSLNLTTNAAFKKYEKQALSGYFSAREIETLKSDSTWDVTTIKVDLHFSNLKPYHAKAMTDLYHYLSSDKRWSLMEGNEDIRSIKQGTEE